MLHRLYRRYWSSFEGLPAQLWVLALVMLVNRSGAMVLAYLTLYLTSEVGFSDASAGSMIGVFGVGSIAGALLGGKLVEAIGAVRVQTFCLLAAVPGYLLLPVWREPWAIALNIFLLSLATEAVRPANGTVIARVAKPEDRTRGFALQRLAANLGFAMGGAVGGFLAAIDFRLLFVVDATTTLAAACILLMYFRLQRLPGEAPPADQTQLARPIHDTVFVLFLALFVLSTMVFFQFVSTYTLYLRDYYHLSSVEIGVLFAVNTLVIVATEMLLIDYVKRWPLVRTIGWGCFFSCLGFALLPFGSTFPFAIFAILVMTLGEMLSMSLAAGFVANRAPVGAEGRYMGWWAMGIAVAFVLGPMAGGALYQHDPNWIWYLSLAVGVIVLVGFHLLPEVGTLSSSELPTYQSSLPVSDPADLIAESAGS
jgi:predicted MFS family arabinose efflux permease